MNPGNLLGSVTYAGLGADVSTPLLALNASIIRVIDLYPFSFEQFQKYLKNWDTLEKYSKDLPHLDSQLLKNRYQVRHLTPVTLQRDLNKSLEIRGVRGYWDENLLKAWGRERFLLYELKSLGVDPSTIRVIQNNLGRIELDFDWSINTDIPVTKRKISFIQGDAEDFFSGKSKLPEDWELSDALIVKSIPVLEVMDDALVNGVKLLIKNQGKLILGSSGEIGITEAERLKLFTESAGTNLIQISSNESLEQRIRESVRIYDLKSAMDWHDWAYGWRIHGFKLDFSGQN
ncbi:MAG: hypothetical protein H6625_02850 [Bdellovibrionaceae bacterium]|nr:hypothetical protein [Pseudobdellovibrionaceae bacterium]